MLSEAVYDARLTRVDWRVVLGVPLARLQYPVFQQTVKLRAAVQSGDALNVHLQPTGFKHEMTLHNTSRPHPVSRKAGLESNTEVSTRKPEVFCLLLPEVAQPAGPPHGLWTSHFPQSHKPIPRNTFNTSLSFCFCGNP